MNKRSNQKTLCGFEINVHLRLDLIRRYRRSFC